MSITVAELVALPHLGLEVVAGLAGLEREVGWAHVCELEDPRPWLEGGELVMTTGMAVPREPGRQAAYLERLAACGVAGLAISKDLCAPPLTPSFLHSAERLGFPVVAVSIEVPFVAIARIVVMANSDASSRQLVRQIAVFDALRDSTALSDLPALFRRLEHVSGFELYLCSPAGLPLLPGVPGIPDDRRDLLDRPGDAPAHVPGGYIVSVPVDGKNAGYLLGLRTASAEPGGLGTLQHIATIAALQRATLEREREIDRREGAELLAELLAGRPPGELAGRLDAVFGEAADLCLALIQADDNDAAAAALHSQLTDLGVPHLLLPQQEVALLAPAGAPLAGLIGAVGTSRAGRSRPFRLDVPVGVPRRQAGAALRQAIERGICLAEASDYAEELDWLPVERDVVAALSERILGPLAADKGSLLQTLIVWLESGRRSGETSRQLGVHPHTLAYRLRRIEALIGRDLNAPGTTAELWLAIQARGLLRQPQPPP